MYHLFLKFVVKTIKSLIMLLLSMMSSSTWLLSMLTSATIKLNISSSCSKSKSSNLSSKSSAFIFVLLIYCSSLIIIQLPSNVSTSSLSSSSSSSVSSMISTTNIENNNSNNNNNNHHHHHGHHQQPQHLQQQQQQRPPRIKEHPNSAVVRKHEPVTLSCKADGYPEPIIDWYRDNELVRKSPNHIYLNNGDLFILKVMNHRKERDTGTYYCLARNIHGKARSHNATIEIATIRDDFRQLPKNVYANVGEMAVMECSPPRGYPEPTVRWRKDDKFLMINDGNSNNNQNNDDHYRLSGTNLQIINVRPEDQGNYQCVAQNMAGSRESPLAKLNVRVKPYFIRKPEDVTVLANDIAEIHCEVGGDPTPIVSWRREGVVINGEQILSQRATITDYNSLKIMNVTEEDEGLYVCQAENLVDRISHSATLIVHSKPTFIIEPKDVHVSINSIARFDCVANGNPRPSVFWNKEGNQFLMFPDNKYERFLVTPEGSLIISPVHLEDKGYYVCSALSVVSSARTKAYLNVSSSSSLLSMQSSEMLNVPPPIIVLGSIDQILPEHTTAILPCDVIGQPKPIIKWYYNNQPLSLNQRFKQSDSGTLQIDDLQINDSGEYKCHAYSKYGETSWSSKLLVKSPHNANIMFHRMPDPSTFPEAPSRPNIINITDTTITIQWIRNNHNNDKLPFKGFIIEYYSPDYNHNEWIRAARNIQTDYYTITGLRSDTRYYFLVRSENSNGIGPPSSISYEARTTKSTSSKLKSYNNNNINNNNNNDIMSTITRTYSNDLNEIRKKLENTIIELKDVRTISSSSVKLFWTVHTGNNNNKADDDDNYQDFIEGFYIRYRKIDPKQPGAHQQQEYENYSETKYQMHTVYNNGQTTYVVNNLPKYTTFEFFIVPFYHSFDGRPSNSRIVRTLDGVPSTSPISIRARPINLDSALIQWQQPPINEINGILLGYIIFVHGTYSTYNINVTVDSNVTSYLLRNLTIDNEYVIQITAFTSQGIGVPSAPLTFIMDPLMMISSMNNLDELQIYDQQKHNQSVTNFFSDTSNVWLYVMIISLIILSLIILLLTFLLLKKRQSIIMKKNDNHHHPHSMHLNRELKIVEQKNLFNSTRNQSFISSSNFSNKGWTLNDHQNPLKQQQSTTMIKLSPTLITTTDNNGYSTVTTDDQMADYADYDYVSSHTNDVNSSGNGNSNDNNYETTTYEPPSTYNNHLQQLRSMGGGCDNEDGPIAYASSNIFINQFHRNQSNTATNQPMQWRTHLKNNDNLSHMKSLNFSATLDRNCSPVQMINLASPPPPTTSATTIDNKHRFIMNNNHKKSSLFINNDLKNITEPLIAPSNIQSNTAINNNQEYDNDNHYHYADSVAYCPSSSSSSGVVNNNNNVTQIPSSKLMANQVKYGSLSRINKQQQQLQHQPQQQQSQFKFDNFKVNPLSNEWKPPPLTQSSNNNSNNRQHLIQNPMMNTQFEYRKPSLMMNDHNHLYLLSSSSSQQQSPSLRKLNDTSIDDQINCDNNDHNQHQQQQQPTYQELS